MKPLKPPVPYFGGKMKLAPRLVELMSAIPHQHYVDVFGGSLAVLMARPPVGHETVNDLDGELMTFWSVLRDRPDELARACALTPHSRAEHAASYRRPRAAAALARGRRNELEVARRVFVQLTQGRAGRRTPTGWRHYQTTAGSGSSMPDYLRAYVRRIPLAATRLIRVSLECMPALDLIAVYGRHEDVLLYVDPPYPTLVRRNGDPRYRGARDYVVEMRTADEHRALATVLQACRASVVLSGYPSSLYDDELYPDWCRVEIPTATGQGGRWSARTEVVWSNRDIAPAAGTLFDGLAG